MAAKKDTYFQFKQFRVNHDRSSMKVGTDAVVLGAWVDCTVAKKILDIGTGSGIIALMLAQRTGDVLIDAIDIGAQDAQQATENVAASPWPGKIKIHHQPLQLFSTDVRYDLIVTNPPYFIKSQLPPSEKRRQAKHTGSLPHDDLLKYTYPLLSKEGKLAIILPVEEGNLFLRLARQYDLYLHRQLIVYSRQGKPQERWIFELGKTKKDSVNTTTLVLHDKGDAWSEEYKKLAKDFYLKL